MMEQKMMLPNRMFPRGGDEEMEYELDIDSKEDVEH